MLTGETISLTTADNRSLNAYLVEPEILVEPEMQPKGGIVILQEIFGVTTQLKTMAQRFAEQGYRSIVPSLFDQISPATVVSYQDAEQGRNLASQCQPEKILMDIQAAADQVKVNDRVTVIGYCWGGTYAYLSACKLNISSAVAYYGTRIVDHLDKKPAIPVLFHFGEDDPMITGKQLVQIQTANPTQTIYTYPGAGHAFSNADRPTYHPHSAELAESRTLNFLSL